MTQSIPMAKKGGCNCSCGGGAADEAPEIDAHALPQPVRHGAILGAIGSLKPGASVVVVTPHEPKPLLRQIADQFGASVTVSNDLLTPDVCKTRVTRTA